MKFSDGFWLMRSGVHACHPAEVLDATAGPGSLVVYAPTQRIRHRGDLLRGPAVTLSFSTPMPDVIGVEITHFAGGTPKQPQFELLPGPAGEPGKGEAYCEDDMAVFTSGALSALVSRSGPWAVDFVAGEQRLTGSVSKATAVIDTDEGRHFIREQLDLGTGHFVYGLGERFGPLVKNGQAVDIWNADGGTSSEQAYKNVPFFLTNAGYGVFVNHPGHVSFEVAIGSCLPGAVQRRGPVDAVLPHLWSLPQGDPAQVHRADRAAGPVAGLVVRAVAVHLVHHVLRRGHGDQLHRGHGRAGPAAARLPLRHVLDARIQLVRLRMGRADLPRPARHAGAAESPRAEDLRLDQPLHRPALTPVRRGPGPRVPAPAARRRRLAVGPLAARDGGGGLHQRRRPASGTRPS